MDVGTALAAVESCRVSERCKENKSLEGGEKMHFGGGQMLKNASERRGCEGRDFANVRMLARGLKKDLIYLKLKVVQTRQDF